MLLLASMAASWARPAHARSPETNTPASSITGEYGTNGLKMNFRDAPLKLVLPYLSETAGFIINKQTEIDGTIEVSSRQPVNKDEAIDLISSALKKKGYALTRNGRILTICSIESAKTADTPVVISNDPNAVEKSDEVQTQVIPIHYAAAAQLVTNLQVLLPTTASLSVNESANTLILVATRTDIKRMLTIVHALDGSMASASSVKVRLLRYANAKDTATLITQLFAPQNTGQASPVNLGNIGFNFGGLPNGAGPPGMLPGAAAQQPEPRQNSGIRRVVAVADERSNAVVLRAPPDLLVSIDDIVDKIDQQVSDPSELRVFRLVNAVPSELADELAHLFSAETGHNNQENDVVNNNLPVFFRGGANLNTQTETDQHIRKFGNVLAVPDPRTSSLIVTAPKALMPQIADMVAALDSDRGKKEIVNVFKLRNADPQDIYQNLQDLFNRGTAHMENNNNQSGFLGRNNPLTQRQLGNQQSSASSALSFDSAVSANPSRFGGGQTVGGTSFGTSMGP
jgi:type II secretory pathway component GspD/PulD (secretin)